MSLRRHEAYENEGLGVGESCAFNINQFLKRVTLKFKIISSKGICIIVKSF